MKFVFFALISAIFIDFAAARFSSSESCDSDSHEHGGGRPHRPPLPPGPPPPRPAPGTGRCDSGWTRFTRPSGPWCMRVFAGQHSRGTADERCRNFNARLSGIQNENELGFMTKSALSVISQNSGSIWLGAMRKVACRSVGLTSTCTKVNSFGWTDKSTTGTAAFTYWNSKQPDNAHGRTQRCVVLFASKSPSVTDQHTTWYRNRMDDIACSPPADNKPRSVRGYVCGKKPR